MRFNESDEYIPQQLDFVPRERRNQVFHLVLAFLVIMMVNLLTLIFPSLQPYSKVSVLLVSVLLAGLCILVSYRLQTTLDLIMTTEYQSMLLAQGLATGTNFSLIVRRDGTIAHASDTMSSVFRYFDYAYSQALSGVFEEAQVRQSDREKILGAIYTSSAERLIFDITQNGEKKEYILTVDPLHRPSGFSLVRGREYLGQRTGSERLPDLISHTSIEKIDYLLATTNMAHYTTDAFGRLEYTNPAFERMFGYEPGEIIQTKLSLHHIILNFGDTTLTEEYTPQSFVGQAKLLHKNSHHFNGVVQQNVMRDSHGKSQGAAGTIVSAGV